MLFTHSHAILSVVLGLIFPLLAILNGNKTKQAFLAAPDKRWSFYQQTVIVLVVASSLVLGSMYWQGENLALIGLPFMARPLPWALLFLLSFASLLIIHQLPPPASTVDTLNKRYKDVLYLLPNSPKAYTWSIGMSIAAGICEEIIFRGFLFWQLHQYLPLIPSILLVNLVFALSHFSTKWKNMVSAFALGVFWSVTFLLTDSLWIAMWCHIVVDMYSMTKGYQLYQAFEDEVSQ